MKTIPFAILIVASSATFAQPAQPPAEERAATPQSCDQLVGMEKEACLKRGGTVKANSAAGGSSSASSTPKPAAKPDTKK